LPGLLVVVLAFDAGGFFPGSWAPLAAVLAIALGVRVAAVDQPFAGISRWTGVALAALSLLGVWTLVSASWSHAPGRATVEFVRLLAYGLVLAICASLAPRPARLAWGIRGVAVAIAAVCVAGLTTRLRPDVWSETGLLAARLDFPVTYWNGLGILAGAGTILALHLSASSREPWPARVLAAGLVPITACTVYLTLSRGGIGATVIGLAVYLVCGFSRATPGALLAIAPPAAVALTKTYGAELLVSDDYAGAAGRAEGRGVLTVLAIAVGAAICLRAMALLLDRVMGRAPSLGRLSVAARAGMAVAAVAILVAAGVVAGAPAFAERQIDRFAESASTPTGNEIRERLTSVSANGRIGHWEVALDAWQEEKLHGTGAGTYQNEWNARRESVFQVLDAHSVYIETLSELGVVGLALLLLALGSLIVGLGRRLFGDDRPAVAAVLAAVTAWAVHAGVDWDWELTSVSVWVFGLSGLALVRETPRSHGGPPRLLRLVVALACLVLALYPAALWRSQVHLEEAATAFARGDCRKTIDAALDSLGSIGARAEPWELIAYCDVRLGQPKLAIDAAEAAVQRDPDNWEYRYALALVQGSAREDPRPAAAEALRLNPKQPEAVDAVKAFRTDRPSVWERRARRLPLYIQ
jgi:hypothetical protein